MRKLIKALSIITALLFIFLYSTLPVLAEGTSVSENAGADNSPSVSADAADPASPSTNPDATDPASPSTDPDATDPASPSAGADATDPASPSAGADATDPVSPSAGADATDSATPSASADATDSDDDILNIVVPMTDVLNIVVPTMVSITLDPLELAGKGQIYSDTYNIENLGDSDVLITLTDIQVTFANDTDFEALAQPYDASSESALKAICLVMDFGQADIPPIIATDTNREAPVAIVLNGAHTDTEGSSHLSLSFSGSLNENPAVPWFDGDVKILITYSVKTVPIPDEEDKELDADEEAATGDDVQEAAEETTTEPAPSMEPSDKASADVTVPAPSAEISGADSEPSASNTPVSDTAVSDTQVAGSSDKVPVDEATPEPSAGDGSAEPPLQT